MKRYKIIAIGVFMALFGPISAYADTGVVFSGNSTTTIAIQEAVGYTSPVWCEVILPLGMGTTSGQVVPPPFPILISGFGGTSFDGVYNVYCDDSGAYAPGSRAAGSFTVSGSSVTYTNPTDATQILTVTPPDGYITGTSTTITVGTKINVNTKQWADALAANNGNWFVQITLYPKNTLPSIPSAAGAFDAAVNSAVIIFPITINGISNFSTTTVLKTEGPTTYTMSTQIIQPNPYATVLQFFGFGSAQVLDATTTSFINGEPSGFDTLVSSSTDIIGDFFASSSPALIASCASFTGFNLGDCLNLLFIPQSGDLARVLNDLNNGLFTFVPWGYVTRTINILGGQATSSFPLIAVGIIDPSSPHQYMMFHFDPNEMIAGAAQLNNNIVDPVSGDLVMPGIKQIVDTVIALSVITFIFYDLIGGKKSSAVHKTKLS